MITRPLRKRHRLARPTKDSKRRNENHDLGPTIQRSRNQVIPLDEPLRPIPTEIKLPKGTQDIITCDRGIKTDKQFTEIPQDDGRVKIRPDALAREDEAVHDIKGQRGKEANEVGGRDPLVAGADGEHLGGDGPGDGERVELLDLGAGPDVASLGGLEEGGLVLDDADHHYVVEKGADDAPDHLRGEGGAGGEFVLLGEFEVAEEEDPLRETVVGVGCEVHVCCRTKKERLELRLVLEVGLKMTYLMACRETCSPRASA